MNILISILTINKRIQILLLNTTYKIINSNPFNYLVELFYLKPNIFSLCTDRKQLLIMPQYNMKLCEYRSFRYSAPLLWNLIPQLILFKKHSEFVKCLKLFYSNLYQYPISILSYFVHHLYSYIPNNFRYSI